MKWYRDRIFPYVMKMNIGRRGISEKRMHLLKHAQGNVLEIGIGTGTNLALYPDEITRITAVDPYARKLP